MSTAGAPAPRRRWLRRSLLAAAVFAVLAALALVAIGWYYSTQILTPGGGALAAEAAAVLDVDEAAGTVTLSATGDTARDGAFGLVWDEGYAQVGSITAARDDAVTRELLEVVEGDLVPGIDVGVDGGYFSGNAGVVPADLREVAVEGELGTFPAYRSDGSGGLWVLVVHGRGASRAEGFRLAAVLDDLDVPTLLLTYRNDPGAPASPDGLYGMGATEWRDVEAAIDHAVDEGAERVVLAGLSTGGAISATLLHESDRADRVSGLILDAPVLDWGPTLRLGAEERGLPPLLTSVAMAVSEVRTGIRWDELDQVGRAEDFAVPILLFHGAQDRTVPVELAQAFAAARPDLVTYVEEPSAGHVQVWNVDPQGYAARVGTFLDTLANGP